MDENVNFGNCYHEVMNGSDDQSRFLADVDKNTWAFETFKQFPAKNNELNEPHNIPPTELNNHLAKFIISVRQKNGDEYQPSCLRGIIGSIKRCLKRNRYGTSIITGYEFSKTREALKSKQKHLKKRGHGNKPKAADPLTNNDIDKLYKAGQLGNQTPFSIINTLWLNNTIHFGM
ncbi:hypothetical protein KUTeg_024263 [Tegillarca granosa]|uniref:DUF3504 domain-containing protein n=1 Tax=Tegillarca granosa TaxID=220873 RepID=A0ABQ9E2E0_TEGGR|nr:hypothetical protein KUTeg_024263 [Tegillarca granosa]